MTRTVRPSRVAHPAHLGATIVGALVASFAFASVADAEPIRGAGSTFAAPIIGEWGNAYEEARRDGGDFFNPDWAVDYEPVGSLARGS